MGGGGKKTFVVYPYGPGVMRNNAAEIAWDGDAYKNRFLIQVLKE